MGDIPGQISTGRQRRGSIHRGTTTEFLRAGSSMAIGWLRGGVSLGKPDVSSVLIDRGDERVPDSVNRFISMGL